MCMPFLAAEADAEADAVHVLAGSAKAMQYKMLTTSMLS